MHSRLRILYISNHRRFKIHFRAYPWAREMAARGHDVDVMCHADTERWRTRVSHVDGFRLIENPDLLIGALRQGWDPVCARRRRNFLFREAKTYDIVHCLDTRPAVIWPALAYARAKGIAIVSDWIDWWGRGGLISERRPWWYRILFAGFETYFEERYRNKLDGLTAISHALVDRAVALGVPRGRCLWIPGGANLAAFRDVPTQAEGRELHNLPCDVPIVCFSGLDVLIDLQLALECFKDVLNSHPKAIFLLVGPTETEVKQFTSDTRVLAQVRAVGPKPYAELGSWLASADVFLMPFTPKISNIGRWPNKIGDYMCVGRPTVSNPVGEVKRLFEQYPVGLLADPTPTAMASAVSTLLTDAPLASRMGREARRVAEQHLSWPILVADLERWYGDILARTATENAQPR